MTRMTRDLGDFSSGSQPLKCKSRLSPGSWFGFPKYQVLIAKYLRRAFQATSKQNTKTLFSCQAKSLAAAKTLSLQSVIPRPHRQDSCTNDSSRFSCSRETCSAAAWREPVELCGTSTPAFHGGRAGGRQVFTSLIGRIFSPWHMHNRAEIAQFACPLFVRSSSANHLFQSAIS